MDTIYYGPTIIESFLQPYDYSTGDIDPLSFALNAHFDKTFHYAKNVPVSCLVNFFVGFSLMMFTDPIRGKFNIENVFLTDDADRQMFKIAILTNGSTHMGSKPKRQLHTHSFYYGSGLPAEFQEPWLSIDHDIDSVQFGLDKLHSYQLIKHFKASNRTISSQDIQDFEMASYEDKVKILKKLTLQNPLDENAPAQIVGTTDRYYSLYTIRQETSYIPKIFDSRISLVTKQISSYKVEHPHDFSCSNKNSTTSGAKDQNTELNSKKFFIALSKDVFASSETTMEFDINSFYAKFEKLQKISHDGFAGEISSGLTETLRKLGEIYANTLQSSDMQNQCWFLQGILLGINHLMPISLRTYGKPYNNEFFTDVKFLSLGENNSIARTAITLHFPDKKWEIHRDKKMFGQLSTTAFTKVHCRAEIDFSHLTELAVDCQSSLKDSKPSNIIADIMQIPSLYGNDYLPSINHTFRRYLNKIKPTVIEHSNLESNYIGQHFLGSLMSYEFNEQQRYGAYQLLNVNDTSSAFLIDYQKGSQHLNHLLIIFETENQNLYNSSNRDSIARKIFNKQRQDKRRTYDDTLVCIVKQNNCSVSLDRNSAFIDYEIEFLYTRRFQLENQYTMIPIQHIPIKNTIISAELEAQTDLSTVLNIFTNAIRKNVGQKNTTTVHQLRATLDGIFSNFEQSITKNVISMPRDALYYAHIGQYLTTINGWLLVFDFSLLDLDIDLEFDADEDFVDPTMITPFIPAKTVFLKFLINFGDSGQQIVKSKKILKVSNIQEESSSRHRRSLGKWSRRPQLHKAILKRPDGTIVKSSWTLSAKGTRSLNRSNKISLTMSAGFTVNYMITSAMNGDWRSFSIAAGTLVTTTLPPFGKALMKTKAFLSKGPKFIGFAKRALNAAPKASLVFSGLSLINNAVAYANNPNNTNAQIDLAVSAICVTIDATVLALEVASTFGVVSGSIASAAGPIGAAIAVAIVIAVNIYKAVNQVAEIKKVLSLTWDEELEEGLRAFAGYDKTDFIGKLYNKKLVNQNHYLPTAVDLLDRSSTFADVAIINGGDAVGEVNEYSEAVEMYQKHNIPIRLLPPYAGNYRTFHNKVIDMRQKYKVLVSRSSPDLPVERNDLEMVCKLGTTARFAHKASERTQSVYEHKIESGYNCFNAFGIGKKGSLASNKSAIFYFDYIGASEVHGFPNKKNLFITENKGFTGSKSTFEGGNLSDTFMLGLSMNGSIDGKDGFDTLDLSLIERYFDMFHFNETDHVVAYGFEVGNDWNVAFHLNNIEEIVGRKGIKDYIICDSCSINRIRSLGGSDTITLHQIPKCERNLTIELYNGTFVQSYHTTKGNLGYVYDHGKSQPNHELNRLELRITGLVSHILVMSTCNLKDTNVTVVKDSHTHDVTLTIGNQRVIYFRLDFRSPFAEAPYFIPSDPNDAYPSEPSMLIIFDDNATIEIYKNKQWVIRIDNSSYDVKTIFDTYGQLADSLGSTLVAFSNKDQESILIPYRSHVKLPDNVKQNKQHYIDNDIHSKSNLQIKESNMDYIISINAECNLMQNHSNYNCTFPTMKIMLSPEKTENVKLIIHTFSLIEAIENKTKNSGVFIRGARINNSLILEIEQETYGRILSANTKNKLIGKIIVENAFKNNFSKKIEFHNYGQFSISEEKSLTNENDLSSCNSYMRKLIGQNEAATVQAKNLIYGNSVLKAMPLEFEHSYDTVVITQKMIEWFQDVKIDKEIGEFDYYHINRTSLVITNLPYTFLYNSQDALSIIIEDYFLINKLQTLKIKTNTKIIDLYANREFIEDKAQDIVEQYAAISNRNDQFGKDAPYW